MAMGVGLYVRLRQSADAKPSMQLGSEAWYIGLAQGVQPGNPPVVNSATECRELLRCDWRSKEYAQHGDCLTLLEARAGPNQRLVETFGIDNAFTTIDPEYRKDFVVEIMAKLRTTDVEWGIMSDLATNFVRTGLEHGDLQDGILLAPLVQNVVLKVVLSKFFPQEAKLSDDAAIATTAECINVLWMESKDDKFPAAWKVSMKQSLVTALSKLLPKHEARIPRRNPLNIILPAYETLWRVVLRCLIEILWRRSSMSASWEQAFLHFAANGYRFSLNVSAPTAPNAEDLVNETLRLYPPTRRVYRWRQTESPHGTLNAEPELVSADMEALHRDENEEISKESPMKFRVGRWRTFHQSKANPAEMPASFMPFGYGSLSCPAKGDFGPKIIMVLVRALYSVLKEADLKLTTDDETDMVPKQLPLETSRESYMSLRLSSPDSQARSALKVTDDVEDRSF